MVRVCETCSRIIHILKVFAKKKGSHKPVQNSDCFTKQKIHGKDNKKQKRGAKTNPWQVDLGVNWACTTAEPFLRVLEDERFPFFGWDFSRWNLVMKVHPWDMYLCVCIPWKLFMYIILIHIQICIHIYNMYMYVYIFLFALYYLDSISTYWIELGCMLYITSWSVLKLQRDIVDFMDLFHGHFCWVLKGKTHAAPYHTIYHV